MGWRAWHAYEQDADARWRALPWRERYSWQGIIVFAFIVAFAMILVWAGIARAETVAPAETQTGAQCKYASQQYSVGSFICECPSVKIRQLRSTGEEGQITGRKLSCDKDGSWRDTNTLCLDISGRASVSAEYPKYVAMFCPHVNISPVETEKFFELAPKEVTITAVQVICRRFGALADACKAIIAAIQATAK